MSKICVVVLIGLPAAGKSTLCKYIQKQIDCFYNAIHIKYDSYDMNPIYKEFRWNIMQDVQNMLQIIAKEYISSKWIILIDDNMYYSSMRKNYYNLAKKYTVSYCQLYLNCNIDIAISRNEKRLQNSVPVETILKMSKKIEAPSFINWEKYSLCLDSNKPFTKEDFNSIWNLITTSLNNPVVFVKTEKQIQEPSQIHHIDIFLRKVIHKKLSENKEKLQNAEALAEKKKYILNEFKNNSYEMCFENDDAVYSFLYSLLDN